MDLLCGDETRNIDRNRNLIGVWRGWGGGGEDLWGRSGLKLGTRGGLPRRNLTVSLKTLHHV